MKSKCEDPLCEVCEFFETDQASNLDVSTGEKISLTICLIPAFFFWITVIFPIILLSSLLSNLKTKLKQWL